MRQLRFLIISIATICAFALAAFALVNRPPVSDPGDDIIIKGGSLEIQCGKNHGNDCLGAHDATGKYKHQKGGSHIRRIVIKDVTGKEYDKTFTVDYNGKGEVPTIVITYN